MSAKISFYVVSSCSNSVSLDYSRVDNSWIALGWRLPRIYVSRKKTIVLSSLNLSELPQVIARPSIEFLYSYPNSVAWLTSISFFLDSVGQTREKQKR